MIICCQCVWIYCAESDFRHSTPHRTWVCARACVRVSMCECEKFNGIQEHPNNIKTSTKYIKNNNNDDFELLAHETSMNAERFSSFSVRCVIRSFYLFRFFLFQITLHFVCATFQLYFFKGYSKSEQVLAEERARAHHTYLLQICSLELCVCSLLSIGMNGDFMQIFWNYSRLRVFLFITKLHVLHQWTHSLYSILTLVTAQKKREMIGQTECTRGEKERMEFFPAYINIITCFRYVWICFLAECKLQQFLVFA